MTYLLYCFCFLLTVHVGTFESAGRKVLLQGDGVTRDIFLGEDPDFLCPDYGAWPHPERCELYYTCYLGEPTYLWQCRMDYLFDLMYYGCNFPELTDCGDRLRPGETAPPRTTTTISTSTSPTTSEPFECPTSDGVFPIDPDVCQPSYYVCVADVPHVDVCGVGLVFDPNLFQCVSDCSVTM